MSIFRNLSSNDFENVLADGGVRKQILRASEDESAKSPVVGEQVGIFYAGKLEDGTEFDSNRKTSEYDKPLIFIVGGGSVISGMDFAVQSMKVGEVALFEMKSGYAYGDDGAPGRGTPDIPGGATIYFEIELIGSDTPEV